MQFGCGVCCGGDALWRSVAQIIFSDRDSPKICDRGDQKKMEEK